jgi:ceramide glucosyltransferase
MAWIVGVWGVGDELLKRKLWIVPLRDAIHFFVWIGGFVSNRVSWGGVEYTIHKGEMEEVRSFSP